MTSTIDNSLYTSREIKKVSERINIKKVELNKYQNIKLKLYEDLKSYILTEEEYKDFNILYTNKINETKNLIVKFEEEIEVLASGKKSNQLWIDYFKKYENIPSLSRELVVNLIEKIVIHRDKIVDIHFKYRNEYDNLLNYMGNIDKLQVACNG